MVPFRGCVLTPKSGPIPATTVSDARGTIRPGQHLRPPPGRRESTKTGMRLSRSMSRSHWKPVRKELRRFRV